MTLPGSMPIGQATAEPSGEKRVRPYRRLTISLVGAVAVSGVLLSLAVAPGMVGFLGACLFVCMLIIAIVDAQSFVIPDPLVIAGLSVALVQAALLDPNAVVEGIGGALLRGGVLSLVFALIRTVYVRVRGFQGMGLGDVKLAAVAGASLSWPMMPLAMEIAAFSGLTVYALRQFIFTRPIRATHRIPFGLFFAPAIWICWLLEMFWFEPY